MPFNKTPKLPEGAQVRIFFDGLQLLCPEVNQSSRTMDCHAYILNAREHLLSVEVSIDRGGPNFPFLRLGAEVTTGGLEIGFDKPRGVTKYVPDPANGHAKDESYDFKWAIDIQEIHQPIFVPIKVNERGVHHGRIKLNEGILYSAELTPPTTGVSLR